jgi:hypothetical protein
MRRFKSRLFKKKDKKSKVITRRRVHRKSKKRKYSDGELSEWENNQIELAIQEASIRRKKHLTFAERVISIQRIPKRYTIPEFPSQEDLKKLLDVNHLIDPATGLVTYWGKFLPSERPKPRLVNGHRSPEDVIFNPVIPPCPVPITERELVFARKRVQLMRRLGFDEPRDIRQSPPTEPLSKKIIKRNIKRNNKWRVYSRSDSSTPGDSSLPDHKTNPKKEVKTYTVIQLNGDIYETDSENKALAHADHNAIVRKYTPGQHILVVKYRVKKRHGKKELIEISKTESLIY